jgi:hypothetical protein
LTYAAPIVAGVNKTSCRNIRASFLLTAHFRLCARRCGGLRLSLPGAVPGLSDAQSGSRIAQRRMRRCNLKAEPDTFPVRQLFRFPDFQDFESISMVT